MEQRLGEKNTALHLSRLDLPHPITAPHEANEDAIAHEIVHLLYALAHIALVLTTLFPRARDLLAFILGNLAVVKIRIFDARQQHALDVREQIVKRDANLVRGPDFDVPRQSYMKQFHVGRWRLRGKASEVIARNRTLQFAEHHPRNVLPQVPQDRRFPDCGETDAFV
jgi:hypothetical protein